MKQAEDRATCIEEYQFCNEQGGLIDLVQFSKRNDFMSYLILLLAKPANNNSIHPLKKHQK